MSDLQTDTHTDYCYTWTIKADEHTLTDVLTHTHTQTTAAPGLLRQTSTQTRQ